MGWRLEKDSTSGFSRSRPAQGREPCLWLRAQRLGKVAGLIRRGDYPPTRAGAASAAARARVETRTTQGSYYRVHPTPTLPLKGEGRVGVAATVLRRYRPYANSANTIPESRRRAAPAKSAERSPTQPARAGPESEPSRIPRLRAMLWRAMWAGRSSAGTRSRSRLRSAAFMTPQKAPPRAEAIQKSGTPRARPFKRG